VFGVLRLCFKVEPLNGAWISECHHNSISTVQEGIHCSGTSLRLAIR